MRDFDAKKGKIAKKAHRGKKSEKKIFGPPPRPRFVLKKKNKERELSLSFPHSHIKHKRRKTYISMAGARLIVFYFATLSPSYSLSLSKGARAFLRSFLFEKQLRAPWISSLFFFVCQSECASCVCVGGSFISFFCACHSRAFRACFLTTTTTVTTTTRAWRSNSRRRRDDYVHAGRSPVANDETIDTSSFYSHRKIFFL